MHLSLVADNPTKKDDQKNDDADVVMVSDEDTGMLSRDTCILRCFLLFLT